MTAEIEMVSPGGEASPVEEKERRGASRFSCLGAAEVIVLGGGLRFTARVANLSLTGCRLLTTAAFSLERGTQMEIVMEVHRIRFRVLGGVRSTHRVRGVGIEFLKLSPRSAGYIRDLISELRADHR